MATFEVQGEMAVPAEKVWGCLRDFGKLDWVQGLSDLKVVGSGVGMTRILNGTIHEVLESLDERTRTLTYTISKGLPLPVKNYRGVVRVDSLGADKSRVRWTCHGEPDGVSEEQARQAVTGMYQMMIGLVRTHLGG